MTPRQEADAAHREVVRLLKEAGERCRRIILNPPGRTERAQNFYASRAAQQLASLNRELDALSSRAVGTAAKGIAAAYQQGLRDAEQQARDAGVRPSDSPLAGGFNVVDRRRAKVLVDQTVSDVHKAVISMRENTARSCVKRRLSTLTRMTSTGCSPEERSRGRRARPSTRCVRR